MSGKTGTTIVGVAEGGDEMYELRKDIFTPSGYIRAGVKKTSREWEAIFPICNCSGNTEWFIDIQNKPVEFFDAPEAVIVNYIFNKHGLASISYKQAALECLSKYKRYLEARTKWSEADSLNDALHK
jgi:hypothetical protein